MITARLKAIFFSMLCTQLLSLTVTFAAAIVVAYYSSWNGDLAWQLIFFLLPMYILDMLGILVSFRWKISSLENKINVESRSFLVRAIGVIVAVSFLFLIRAFLSKAGGAAVIVLGFTLVSIILIITAQYLVSTYLTTKNNIDVNKIKVLIIGMNQRANSFADVLVGSPLLGIDIIGYIDTAENKDSNMIFMGPLSDVDEILKKEVIDEIFIFLPIRSFYDEIHSIIKQAGFYGITTNMLGHVFETGPARQPNICLSDFTSTAYSSSMQDQVALVIKRLIDVVLSFTALVILSPLLILVTIYIKLVSPGPAIFVQQRAGYNKRVFNIYKFRTMVPDAEKMLDSLMKYNEMDGAAFKITNDPRLFKGAKFLRRFSIDELPQLLNVLFGDMSIVGPRPLSLRDYNYLSDDWQRKRFSVKPGLTCIWQVSGRNDVSFNEWMSMDIEYVETWSLWLDFKIMLKTFLEVFRGGGK